MGSKALTSYWIHLIAAASRQSSRRQWRQLNQLHHSWSTWSTHAGISTAATCTASTTAGAKVRCPRRVSQPSNVTNTGQLVFFVTFY